MSAATTSDSYGDTLRYLAGRERTLGKRVVVPEDVDGAAEVLSAVHGGPRRASAWLRQVLRQLDGRTS